MSVLVTGASGFIGLNLAEALLRRGETVILLSRRRIASEPAASQPAPLRAAARVFSTLPGQMHSLSVDLLDASALARIMTEHRPEVVVHGAAATPGADREVADARLAMEVNVLGTLNVLEAARKVSPRRIISLSSGAVYGETRAATGWLDEERDLPVPDSVYSISKHASERLALRWRNLWDLDLAVARVGTVFGPWEWSTGVRETISTIFQLTRLAIDGTAAVLPVRGKKDWIYSRDIADGIIALMDAPLLRSGAYNIGPGVQWDLLDWCERLAKSFPGFSYRLAATGEKANVFYGSKDRDPFSSDRLAADTGFRARYSLDAAATDYSRWIEETPDFWADPRG